MIMVLLLGSTTVFGQMYVSPSGSMIAKNTVVYVKQDVFLDGSSRFFLRNEAQLVQGTTSISTNKGTGLLSVFQEGNVNNYAYNYWCAPIGLASASTGNADFGITLLNRPTTISASTAAVTASGLDGTANPLTIASNWIYRYVNGDAYSQWTFVGSATSVPAGQGFTMKGTSGTDALAVEGNGVQNNPGSAQRYDFRGKPNDGNISVPVSPSKFTLTGNPYPSALHVNAFLLDAGNAACTGIAYYWEQDKTVNSHYVANYKGGYGTFSPVSIGSAGVYVPATFDTYNADGSLNTTGASSGQTAIQRRYAPIGQGFVIQGASSGTSVTIRNSHRIYFKESSAPNSQFYRMTPPGPPGTDTLDIPLPIIRLNTSFNEQSTRQLVLTFPVLATPSVDRGIDAENVDVGLPADISFYLEEKPYVIEGLPFTPEMRVPLIASADEETSFRFSLLETLEFDPAQPIYLYDAQDDSYHNLKEGAYTATIAPGVDTERFEITFQEGTLGMPSSENPRLTMWMDSGSASLQIQNPALQTLNSVIIFDIAGRRVAEWDNLGNEERLSLTLPATAAGVYIVTCQTSSGNYSRKIVVGKGGNP